MAALTLLLRGNVNPHKSHALKHTREVRDHKDYNGQLKIVSEGECIFSMLRTMVRQ